MLERKNVLVLAIILGLGSISLPSIVHLAHAATGVVCLADPTTAMNSTTPCPTGSAVFDGPVGQQIRIGVFIQGSDGLSGFDIVLLTNHIFLKPIGVDLTGTVLLGNYHPIAECLSSVLILGNVCSTVDTIDTLDLAEEAGLGIGNTASPTTGLLFTAIYNITGTNPAGTPLPVGFQTGCSGTSVSPNVCVTITNGTTSPISETTQGATFDNSASAILPTVVLSSNPSSLGPQFPGVASIATITATAENGFPGFGTDSVTFTDKAIAGLTATIQGANPCSTLGTSCSVTVAMSSATEGNYSVTIFGTYSTADPNGNGETLTSSARINLVVWDFGFSLSTSSLSLIAGTTGEDQALLTSQNGFSGSVTFSTGNSVPSGITTNISPATVVLQSNTSAASTISFTAPQNATGTYRVQIRATSESRSRPATSSITITAGGTPDFSLSANPQDLVFSPKGSVPSTIAVTSINGFANPVSFSITSSPGLTASIFPQIITGSGNTTLTVSSTTTGNYTANIVGTSGTISHDITLRIQVTSTPIGKVCLVPSGASSCTLSAAPITGVVGEQVSVSVLIQNSASFDGFDITLLSDHSVLRPVSVDLTGTILPAPFTIGTECVGGVLVQGPNCTLSNSDDTIQFVVLSVSGHTTTSPATGLLFTAIYSVMANTTGTDIGFQTGCLSSSTPPLCINISDGITANPVKETDPIAIFSTSTTPDFGLSADPPALKAPPGSRVTSTVFLTSFNGFNQNVTLSDSILPTTGLTCSLNSTMVNPISETSSLSCDGIGGTYSVTVTGTSGKLYHSTAIQVTLPYFVETANPTILLLEAGQIGTSNITLTPFSGFAGFVALSTSIVPGTGLGCSLDNSIAFVGIPTNSMLSCNGVAGSYTVTAKGTSGTISVSASVTITIEDFSLNAVPSSTSLTQGSSAATTVTVTSLQGFNGTVSLTAAYSPSLQITLNPTSVTGSGSSTLTITATSTALGTYLVNITGTSNHLSHTTTVTVTVSTPNTHVLPPTLTQAIWAHRLSLSETNGVQTWQLGIRNPNHNTIIYASIRIVGADSLNTTRFTLNTPVYQLNPSQSIMNIQETQTFTTQEIGTIFTITITVQWGLTHTTSPTALPFTTTSIRTGSFTIQS
jgi:hypothetical protein